MLFLVKATRAALKAHGVLQANERFIKESLSANEQDEDGRNTSSITYGSGVSVGDSYGSSAYSSQSLEAIPRDAPAGSPAAAQSDGDASYHQLIGEGVPQEQ